MKRLLISLLLLVVVGAGCPAKPAPAPEMTGLYENGTYGFSIAYDPSVYEVRERDEAVQVAEYLGLETRFFASLRDHVRAEKPENIAAFYGVDQVLTPEAFIASAQAAGVNGEFRTVETIKIGGLTLKKVMNATDIETDKTHYLFERGGRTVIISVFIAEDEGFEPMLRSLKAL